MPWQVAMQIEKNNGIEKGHRYHMAIPLGTSQDSKTFSLLCNRRQGTFSPSKIYVIQDKNLLLVTN